MTEQQVVPRWAFGVALVLLAVLLLDPIEDNNGRFAVAAAFQQQLGTLLSSRGYEKDENVCWRTFPFAEHDKANLKSGQWQSDATSSADGAAAETSNIANDRHSVGNGRVVRIAARAFAESSKPMSKRYTTRKDELYGSVPITKQGVVGDYNHYRCIAMRNTTDRAVSIVTTDIMKMLRNDHRYPARDGDLGENLLVDGVEYNYFVPGGRYRLDCRNDDDDVLKDRAAGVVVIEITEPMVPCANLCRLPYVNDPDKDPKQQVETCRDLLQVLDQKPGVRGWYAKVVAEGKLERDCTIRRA